MYAGIIILILIIIGLGYLIYKNISFEKNEKRAWQRTLSCVY